MKRSAVFLVCLSLVAALLTGRVGAQDAVPLTFRGSDIARLAHLMVERAGATNQLYQAYDLPLANGRDRATISATHTFELLGAALLQWRVKDACPAEVQLRVTNISGPEAKPQLEPRDPGRLIAVNTQDILDGLAMLGQLPVLKRVPFATYKMGNPPQLFTAAQYILAMACVIDQASKDGKLPTQITVPLVKSPAWDTLANPAQLLPPPELIAPRNGSRDQDIPVHVTWQVVQAQRVVVSVALDSQFTQVISEQEVTGGTALDLNALTYGQQYWWRARAIIDGADSGWSRPYTFITKPRTLPSPKPAAMPPSLTDGGSAQPAYAVGMGWLRQITNDPVVPEIAKPQAFNSAGPASRSSATVLPFTDPKVAVTPGYTWPRLPLPTPAAPPQARPPVRTLEPISVDDGAQPLLPVQAVLPTEHPSPRPGFAVTAPKGPQPNLPGQPNPKMPAANLRVCLNGLDITDPAMTDLAAQFPLCGLMRLEIQGLGALKSAIITIDTAQRYTYTTPGPHVLVLDTQRLSDDTHTLTATAIDTSGHSYTHVFAFAVRNGRGTGITRPEPVQDAGALQDWAQ